MIHHPKYRIERLEPSRLPDALYLFNTIFGRKESLDFLTRKYDTGWTGIRHVPAMAYHDDKPIGFYGSLPHRMRYKGQPLLAVMTCDSMTLPGYQGQGLHRDLGFASYEFMKSEGVQFVYAYHSEQTFHSCKKLGWELATTLDGFTVPTGGIPLAKVKNRLFKERIWGKFPPGKPSMKNPWAGTSHLHLDYAPDFFQYKNWTPNRIIQVGETDFWIKSAGDLMVGAVNSSGMGQLKQDLATLKRLARKAGYTKMQFHAYPGSKLAQALQPIGVPFTSWKVGYKYFTEGIDFNEWRGNFGDFDTF